MRKQFTLADFVQLALRAEAAAVRRAVLFQLPTHLRHSVEVNPEAHIPEVRMLLRARLSPHVDIESLQWAGEWVLRLRFTSVQAIRAHALRTGWDEVLRTMATYQYPSVALASLGLLSTWVRSPTEISSEPDAASVSLTQAVR